MINSEHFDYSQTVDNNYKSEKEINLKKYHSILPDLATGWRPKNAKIAAPVFITYEDTLTQQAFKNALGCLNKLVYIGPRHDNSYKFHSLTNHTYNVKYGIKCEEVPSKLQKQLQQFTIKSNNRKRLFTGMNPNLDKQLQFESNFQSGNLDLVVKVSNHEYNLFLRPDTNTRGHMQWFYFRVNNNSYPCHKIRFNICNNKKPGVLFTRGMKPYVYSKNLQSYKGIKWQQCGQNISYKRLDQKQDFCNYFGKVEEMSFLDKYYCLSFEYTFQYSRDEVYFAYCPPFTYSEMKLQLNSLKKRSNSETGISVIQQNLCTSLSGLQIPILTITDQRVNQNEKKCIIITGRFHPGQSNGSHVLKGFLEYLISYQGEYLRKRIVFKIIPMINPDGVVFGNYRTSLSGKDLNRKFKAKNQELFPQVVNLKNYVMKLKRESKMKIIYFLDFHGHSMKKNVFLYGPQYDIWSTKFQRSKILPKIIAQKTNMFRYQSCLFRVAATKKTTARAFMLGLIPFCYTIQSSVGLYRSVNAKQNYKFDISKWQQMGSIIAKSLQQTIMKVEKQYISTIKRKKKSIHPIETQSNKQKQDVIIKQIQQKSMESIRSKDKQNLIEIIYGTEKSKSRQEGRQRLKQSKHRNKLKLKQKFRQSQMEKDKDKSVQLKRNFSSKSVKSAKQKQNTSATCILTAQINKNPFLELGCTQIKQVEEESDRYSEGKSDCQSDQNDFNKEQYNKISGKIMKFIENFNIVVVGQRRKEFRMKNKKKILSSLSTGKAQNLVKIQKFYHDFKMVPSLKHKMLKKQISENKIVFQQRQENPLKQKKLSLYKIEEQKKRLFERF